MNQDLKIEYVDPVFLKPNPWNSNKVGPEMEARLEASLREFGFIRPIVARELVNGDLQILGGEHRTRKAREMGFDSVPVIILKGVTDAQAKAMGLVDNGRYGEDDALKLGAILEEIGQDFFAALPFDNDDLAGILAAAAVDLDDLGFDKESDTGGELPPADAPRPTVTHELMRFKVPVEDRERVEKLINSVIKTKGLSGEQDSLVAAGMALVEIVNAAKPHLG